MDDPDFSDHCHDKKPEALTELKVPTTVEQASSTDTPAKVQKKAKPAEADKKLAVYCYACLLLK